MRILALALLIFLASCGGDSQSSAETKKSDVTTKKAYKKSAPVVREKGSPVIRKKIVEELNAGAKQWQSKVVYSQDPNKDTTLIMNAYDTTLSAEDYGGWSTFPEMHGHDHKALIAAGFDLIRVYTSVSGDKYKRRMLLDGRFE